MSSRWPAGIIRKTPVTPAGPFQNGAAPGVWTLAEAAYWTKQGLWPVAGNAEPAGQMVWIGSNSSNTTAVSSYSWTVPTGVTSISAVVVGAGQSGATDDAGATGGAGGALRYATSIAVTPGETLTIEAGNGVYGATGQTSGGASSIKRGGTTLLFAGVGTGTTVGGTIGGGNGGVGGSPSSTRSSGGGGAGGYSGNGGSGQNADLSFSSPPSGGGAYGGTGSTARGGTAGGVGLLGQGASGTGTTATTQFGSNGYAGQSNDAIGYGVYGAGGAGNDSASGNSGASGAGAVRIIWGAGRAFPSNAPDYVPASSSSFSQIEIRMNIPNRFNGSSGNFADYFFFTALEIYDENNVNFMTGLSPVAAGNTTSFSSISVGQFTVNQRDPATSVEVGYLIDGVDSNYLNTRQEDFGNAYSIKIFVKPSTAKRISKIVIKGYGADQTYRYAVNYVQVLGDGVDITNGYAIPVKTYTGATNADTVSHTLTFT